MKDGEQKFLPTLRKKGVHRLYHANSVLTATTFIEQGGLLSRGEVEARGLRQTPQYSDEVDKEHDVWFDVFLDDVDIHRRARQENKYGPILFVLSTEVLRDCQMEVLITKSNPLYWKHSESYKDHYFLTLEELESSYRFGDFKQMIILRGISEILPFERFLRKIVVDSPENVGLDAYDVIVHACREHNIDPALVECRTCIPTCKCYQNTYNSIFRLF